MGKKEAATTIVLPGALAECPRFWRNYIHHLRNTTDQYTRNISAAERTKVLNQGLSKYGIRYSRKPIAGKGAILRIKSEQDAILFMLKFS